MRRRSGVLAAALAFTAVAGVSYAIDGSAGGASEVLGPGLVEVELGIEHSRFSVDRLRVAEGTTVRFIVRNTDPIAHELIVGDSDVHARHRLGNEREHPPVPGEVSVGPHETRSTVFTFDEPGEVSFACHLPGHVAYGMEGVVIVD
jgi:uncharacterized cupredoxin-like copper-binding protein